MSIHDRGLAASYAAGRRRIEQLNRTERCPNCGANPPRAAGPSSAPPRWCNECANAWALLRQEPAEIAEQSTQASLNVLQRALRLEMKQEFRLPVVRQIEDRIRAIRSNINRLLIQKGLR